MNLQSTTEKYTSQKPHQQPLVGMLCIPRALLNAKRLCSRAFGVKVMQSSFTSCETKWEAGLLFYKVFFFFFSNLFRLLKHQVE